MLTGIPSWYRQGGRLSKLDIEEIYLDLARKAVCAGEPRHSGPSGVKPDAWGASN